MAKRKEDQQSRSLKSANIASCSQRRFFCGAEHRLLTPADRVYDARTRGFGAAQRGSTSRSKSREKKLQCTKH